nr:MFS transporter [uncultured Caproiciproducens sp.]
MLTALLIIIYISFISLGLPDSLLGSAWPVMQLDLAVPLSSAGAISMFISGATIISSLLSGKLIRRFGTGKLTLISVTMTAFALLGFCIFPSFWIICLFSIPLGLGAGAVDAGLNNFVALHYKSRHMSWLHCFWGIGATLGPNIMSFFISRTNAWNAWRSGYFTVSMVQFFLAAILLFTLPIWKQFETKDVEIIPEETSENKENPIKIPGVKFALASFFFYCAVESTTGLWGSTYLVNYKGLSTDIAARWTSLFFMGITVGRLICGFITMKLSNRCLIRIGQIISILGITSLVLPLPNIFSMFGLLLIGLGCAPIFPCMIQDTPYRFGKAASQSIIGFQMAFAYMGSTFMPLILGLIASKFSVIMFPVLIFIYVLIMIISSETINRFLAKRDEAI